MAQTKTTLFILKAPWIKEFIRGSIRYFEEREKEITDESISSLIQICKLGVTVSTRSFNGK